MFALYISSQVPASGHGGSVERRASRLPATTQGTSEALWPPWARTQFICNGFWLIWLLYYLQHFSTIQSFIPFSHTVLTRFPHREWLVSFDVIAGGKFPVLPSYLPQLCLWIILKSVFVMRIGFYDARGNCISSESSVTFVSHGFVLTISLCVMLRLHSQRAACSWTASRVCRRETLLNPEKEPSKDLCFALT